MKDDLDYFPKREKVARNDSTKGEWTKAVALDRLAKSGLTYYLEDKDDVAIFRQSGQPTVEFYTRKNRWKVRGQKKTSHGTVDRFINWYAAYRLAAARGPNSLPNGDIIRGAKLDVDATVFGKAHLRELKQRLGIPEAATSTKGRGAS